MNQTKLGFRRLSRNQNLVQLRASDCTFDCSLIDVEHRLNVDLRINITFFLVSSKPLTCYCCQENSPWHVKRAAAMSCSITTDWNKLNNT